MFFRNLLKKIGKNSELFGLFLASLSNHIFLVNKDVDLNGEYNLIQQVKKNPKIQIINETTVTLFDGDNKLRSVWIKNIRTLEVQKIDIDGAFIAIGQQPNTDLFAGQLAIDEKGYLITDCHTGKTSVDGIFAAGDVQEKLFRQAIIACGAGAVAALSAEKYLIRKKS